MLPTSINGLIMDFRIEEVERIGQNRRGQIDFEHGCIHILSTIPPSWKAQTLMHEMVHLAFSLQDIDEEQLIENEEAICLVLGRFLPRVLIDNPGLFDTRLQISSIDILGEIWRVEVTPWPDANDDASMSWDFSSATVRLREDTLAELQRVRLFQMVCQTLLEDGGIEDASSGLCRAVSQQLYALLRANPQAHPQAVIGDEAQAE